ncbi:MAG: beta-lactamase family protein [Deltaproteobacteria bacterium]|nr:beta-lactamase family protein [Deltaproteobacteria bacterium]
MYQQPKTRRFLLLVAFLLSVCADNNIARAETVAQQPSLAISDEKLDQIDALLTQYTQKKMFSGQILIAEGDHHLLRKDYGYADWDLKTPFDKDAIFRIGSLTKQFTAAAILRLEEQGQLSTDDPLSKFIPELSPAILGYKGAPVRLHHLLTHTSGIPSASFGNTLGNREIPFTNVTEALLEKSLSRAPGSEYHYLNLGYVLLGEVIRRLSGKTYEQFLRETFFIPLSMTNTGIKVDATQRKSVAKGHLSTLIAIRPSIGNMGNIIKGEHDLDIGSSGSVFSTINDMEKWIDALRKGKVLSETSKKKMLTPNLENYGFGWVVRPIKGQESATLVRHNGAISPLGYYANVSWNWSINRELKVIVLQNLDLSTAAYEVYANVERLLAGAEPVEPENPLGYINGLALMLTLKLHLILFGAGLLWDCFKKKYRSKLLVISSQLMSLASVFLFYGLSSDWITITVAGVAPLAAAYLLYKWRHLPSRNRQSKKEPILALVNLTLAVVFVKMGVELLIVL